MFSTAEKHQIAEQIQKILRKTNHPELPKGEIEFHLHVNGAESWSWADIKNNGAVPNPSVNPWNEKDREVGFKEEIARTLNKYSSENKSNTPDFILAEYLSDCLLAFDAAVNKREGWHGRTAKTTSDGSWLNHAASNRLP